ncbi:MAG: hypothetical protein WA040_18005 [Anaerolineae bacterium]
MQTLLEQIPRTGEIQLTIQVSARFNYSAQAAQRLVRRFVADEVSYLLRTGEPMLVMGEQLVWRVPLELAFPHTGPVGQVGAIDVHVETGQLFVTPEQITEITRNAQYLALRHASSDGPAS